MTAPTRFADLNAILTELVDGVRGVLGPNFCGAYLQGSFALGAGDEHSDVDFLVVTNGELSTAEQAALQVLHGRLFERGVEWARHLEGSYIPKDLLRRPDPTHARLFYLDNGSRELVWDDHCNRAYVRWTLREHGVVLAGPPPAELVEPVSAEQLRDEARWSLDEYATWARGLYARYQEGDAGTFNRWLQPYLVLTFCRMLYTLARGEVASKASAAEWALGVLDAHWHRLIRRALDDRPWPVRRYYQPAGADDVSETMAFVEYACGREESNLQGPKSTGT